MTQHHQLSDESRMSRNRSKLTKSSITERYLKIQAKKEAYKSEININQFSLNQSVDNLNKCFPKINEKKFGNIGLNAKLLKISQSLSKNDLRINDLNTGRNHAAASRSVGELDLSSNQDINASTEYGNKNQSLVLSMQKKK